MENNEPIAPYRERPALGRKMGDEAMVDAMIAALTDLFGTGHMGITAEIVAERNGVSRVDQINLPPRAIGARLRPSPMGGSAIRSSPWKSRAVRDQ